MAEEIKDDTVVQVNLQEKAKEVNQEPEVHKVDLSKPPVIPNEDPVEEEGDDSVLSEITIEEDPAEDPVEDPVEDPKGDPEEEEEEEEEGVKSELPENIQKLVDFMNDTGGTLEDYTLLNKDVDGMGEDQLLREYHKNVEPGLDKDDLDFLMEDLYKSDEEYDTEKDIKKKTLARKRDLSKAKKHLKNLKDKYYDEIKAGSKLNPEQKKAVDFFNRYNTEQADSLKEESLRSEVFTKETKKLFNDEFKGFEFNVGEKKYRFNVKNPNEIMSAQSDINNFAKKYLGDKNTLKDAKGYHKALFTAMNADVIADHFYKQGMADALKTSAKNSKNINMKPRGVHEKVVTKGGLTVKAVSSDTPPGKLRIKKF